MVKPMDILPKSKYKRKRQTIQLTLGNINPPILHKYTNNYFLGFLYVDITM